MRLVLLDMSGSMTSQLPLLQCALAAVPEGGVSSTGVKVTVMTDGNDTDSEGDYNGTAGLVHLLAEATKRGWNCTDSTAAPASAAATAAAATFGTLHVTLLDVSPGGQSARSAAAQSANATLVWTKKPASVERVVTGNRSARQRRVTGVVLDDERVKTEYTAVHRPARVRNRARAAVFGPSVRGDRRSESVAAAVAAVAALPPSAPVPVLADVISAHVEAVNGDNERKERVRAAILEALEGTSTGYVVDKTSPEHSKVNAVLWELKRSHVLETERQDRKRGLHWKRTARYGEMQ